MHRKYGKIIWLLVVVVLTGLCLVGIAATKEKSKK